MELSIQLSNIFCISGRENITFVSGRFYCVAPDDSIASLYFRHPKAGSPAIVKSFAHSPVAETKVFFVHTSKYRLAQATKSPFRLAIFDSKCFTWNVPISRNKNRLSRPSACTWDGQRPKHEHKSCKFASSLSILVFRVLAFKHFSLIC